MKDFTKMDYKTLARLRSRVAGAKMDILNAYEQLKEICEAAEDVERYKGYLDDAANDLEEAEGKKDHEFGEFDMSLDDARVYHTEAIASLAKMEAILAELCKGNTVWANLNGATVNVGIAEEFVGDVNKSYL